MLTDMIVRYTIREDGRAPARLLSASLLALTLLLLTPGIARAQESPNSAGPSGTEFFVSFPPSDPDATHQFMGVMITSEFSTIGTIEIPDVESLVNPWDTIKSYRTRPFSVRAGEVTMIEVPRLVEPFYSASGEVNHNGEISLRSVRITSRAPVSVTAVNARQGSSGAYTSLPVDRWGSEYTAVALPATPNDRGLTSQLTITAAYDGTVVEVYPSARAGRWSAGERIPTFTLNRGEVWLLQADAKPGTIGSMDLSGTTISASKPVSVVAGHTRAALSTDPAQIFPRSDYAAWHATAQMPTDGDAWGNEYFSTPIRNGGDRFRVMAHDHNTVVELELFDQNGNVAGKTSVYMRWRGQFVDVSVPDGLTLNRPIRWSSAKQFALYQVRTTAGDNSNPENHPAFLRLVPTSDYAARTVFALPWAFRNEAFGSFNIDLTVRGTSSPLSDITLDGTPLADIANVTATPISGQTWRVSFLLDDGGHVLQGSNGAVLTGRVSGTNTMAGGVALDWTLPHWNVATEYDTKAPYLVETQNTSATSVEVVISDRTDSYFSGIADVEVWESPGWERNEALISPDPDVDATARFGVKQGYDPSGPLQIRITDRDGNESIVKVHDGVCLQTAYAMTDTLRLIVRESGSASGEIVIEANPCGDEANVTVATYNLGGNANNDLLAPVIVSGASLPTTVAPYDRILFRVTTRPDLEGTYIHHTHLDVRVDNTVISIPIIVDVSHISGVEEEIRWVEELDLW